MTDDAVAGGRGRPSAASGQVDGGAARRRPLIGVIGGLGPAATLDFYAKVVALTPAEADQEHVRLIIDADPEVPNRNQSVAGTGPSSAPALIAKALRLKAAGAELLVMACNAAHAYQAEIVAATELEFVSIVDEAVSAVSRTVPSAGRVGVLAAAGTLDAGIYGRALVDRGYFAIEPEGELRARFMALLYQIKAGAAGTHVRAEMAQIAAELVANGAEALIAACTEVPLVIDVDDVPVQLIDATTELARAVVTASNR